jgi:hypothetical protein
MNFQRRWRVDIEALSKKKDFFIPKFDSWNLSNNDREKWYALVGYLLENGEIERLRKCSYCGDFFEARDGRQRFCKTKCKDEFFKPTAASRMKKSREKRKKEQERMARKEGKKFRMEKEKALEQNFRALINEMMQGKKGSLVKKLGREQYQAGWNNFVLPWNAQIKRGSSLREILKSLSNEDKEILEPYLIPPEERETVTIL